MTLLVIVGGGIYLMRNAPKLINYYVSLVEREIDRNTDPAVTTDQRTALKEEMRRFRGNLQDREASMTEAQSILLEINRAIRDQRLTAAEVEALTRRLREANERLEKKPASSSVFGPGSLVPGPSRKTRWFDQGPGTRDS